MPKETDDIYSIVQHFSFSTSSVCREIDGGGLEFKLAFFFFFLAVSRKAKDSVLCLCVKPGRKHTSLSVTSSKASGIRR